MSLKIGAVYRYGRPYGPNPAVKNGLPNYFYETRATNLPNLLLEAGINTPVLVRRSEGSRLPVVSIRSSPHKARDEMIPWHDHFDLDLGRIDYYGDNRPGSRAAEQSPGNEALLAETRLHLSPEPADRKRSAPLLVFRSVPWDGRVKGQVRFEGLAVVERCEKIVQVDRIGAPYDNYRFRLGLLDLAADNHRLERKWISDRRNEHLDDTDASRHAPATWRAWIDGAVVDDIRAVAGPDLPAVVEAAAFGTDHTSVLDLLEERYSADPAAFTRMAAAVVEFLLLSAGHRYSTQQVDSEAMRFTGRLQLGISPSGAVTDVVGVVDLRHRTTRLSPRTVASLFEQLEPGVLGVVVTRQVLPVQDHGRFHHTVVDGRRIAQTVLGLAHSQSFDVDELLDRLETRPATIIRAAVAGQARIDVPTDGEP